MIQALNLQTSKNLLKFRSRYSEMAMNLQTQFRINFYKKSAEFKINFAGFFCHSSALYSPENFQICLCSKLFMISVFVLFEVKHFFFDF